jgi:hypothetical protein
VLALYKVNRRQMGSYLCIASNEGGCNFNNFLIQKLHSASPAMREAAILIILFLEITTIKSQYGMQVHIVNKGEN